MINIDLKPMVSGGISRYSLVTAVAKRSREITDEAIERRERDSKDIMVEKPVTLAVEDFMYGNYRILSEEEAVAHRLKAEQEKKEREAQTLASEAEKAAIQEEVIDFNEDDEDDEEESAEDEENVGDEIAEEVPAEED